MAIALASATSSKVHVKWTKMLEYNYTDSESFYYIDKKEETITHAEVMLVYNSLQTIENVQYRSRVSRVVIDCKSKAFVVVYDAYYLAEKPIATDQPIGIIKRETTPEYHQTTTSNTILYKSLCAIMI